MKTTDFAMIFVAIILPIIIVVYVDISFMLKAEEQRLYYTNIINSAINDATYVMKTVEGEEQDIDYGYSGQTEKKVAINARVAVDKFYESLYDNFEIHGDNTSEAYIKNHIPALAVVDYNGVYIYSIDEYIDAETNEKHIGYILKPKRYYTYTYAIQGNEIIPGEDIENFETSNTVTVIFTMDNYISVVNDDGTLTGFYLEDYNNNSPLFLNNDTIAEKIIQHLKLKRSETISNIVSQEMSFAVNNHNMFSEVDYEFVFPAIGLSDWEEMINNVGIIAFVQGINIGIDNLDYVAHGISGLRVSTRYFVSQATTNTTALNYYHSTTECTAYTASYKNYDGYYMDKIEAATAGYYPCPVCKP